MNLRIPLPHSLRRVAALLPAWSRLAIPALGVSLVIFVSPALRADDWPQWRGLNRDARAAGFTAPQTWPKELTQKWKSPVGDGVSTPALVGDKLYVFSREGGNEVTRCLDAATGQEVWQTKYEAPAPNGPAAQFSGPRSSPAVADGKVVTLGVRGTVCCSEAATGKLLWRRDDFDGSVPNFSAASSPLITDGLCIAVLGGKDNGAVAAYDLATGDPKWKWTGDGAAYASPTPLTVEGVKLVATLTEHNVVAIQTGDGKQVWEVPFASQGMGAYNACSPVVDGSTVIYSGSKRGMKAVKLEKDAAGAFTAKDLWANADESVQFNTPALANGLLFGLTQANVLFCVKEQDGLTAWTAPVAAAGAAPAPGGGGGGGGRGMRGGGFGSIVSAGSVMLALTPSSELIAFQPSDKAYTELARYKVAESPTHAYPVAAGNRIFVKDKDSVILWTVE